MIRFSHEANSWMLNKGPLFNPEWYPISAKTAFELAELYSVILI